MKKVIDIFFNNKQKFPEDSAKKEGTVGFKQRQRRNE